MKITFPLPDKKTQDITILTQEEIMDEYFDCITECSLDNKECTTECLVTLKEH